MAAASPQTLKARFQALADMRRWDDALRVGLDWLAADPDSADAHAHQAWAYLRCQANDIEAAERHAREAIGLAPEAGWPPRLLAHALGRNGQWEQALAAVQESLRLDPTDDQSHVLAARCLCRLGRSAEALPHAQRAVELDPNDADHRRFLHWLEYLDKSTAADVYNRMQKLHSALALDPTNVHILRDLAAIHASDLGDYAAAEELLRQAVELAPDDSDIHGARADLQSDRDLVYRTIRVPWAFASSLGGPLRRPDDDSPSEIIAWGVLALVAVSCCVPAAGLAFVPTKAYEWMVLSEYRASRVRWPLLARWLHRLGRLPLWLRRTMWAPVPVACIGLVVWLLPIPPALSLAAILACAGGCAAFAWRMGAQARANRQLLAEVVTAESADDIILAEPVEDVIRAELA